MTQVTSQAVPGFLPATSHAYLLRSASSLADAMESGDTATRYACAHVAALQAAAALLGARPAATLVGRRRPQRNAWVLLAEVAPELADWAAFFSSGAAKRAAAEAGSTRAVSETEADQLVGEADRFLAVVEQALGLVPHASLSTGLERRVG
jgi:hypothetical protein